MNADDSSIVSLAVSPGDFLWAVGSVANLQRLPFDAVLTSAAYPAPHSVATLVEALRAIGTEVEAVTGWDLRRVTSVVPCLVLLRGSSEDDAGLTARPALLARVEGDRVVLFEAGTNTAVTLDANVFAGRFLGIALRAHRREAHRVDSDPATDRPFGFRWFVPELLRHRRIWREVLAASLAVQLLGLALPLLSQVVIDKVIVHRTTSTLAVIAAALATVVAFSSAIAWIRQYLVIHTGNRIDAVLGTTVFRHLFALPPRYFERRPTGVLTARLAGIETIREFLTGASITLALDVPFLIVFLAIMFFYSVPLTLMTLGVVAAMVVASAIAAPQLQKRFDAQFLASARTQAFVTEHIAGMETVKSLQLEPALDSRYERLLAQYLDAGFRTRQLGNSYGTVTQTLEQLLSASILCAGAYIVMTSSAFTIGMLVAFQMFATRVAQPLLRLTALWQQFQQAAIAVRRLADVMDVPAEPQSIATSRPARGPASITFAGVGFRYGHDRPWLYRDFSLHLKAGECVVVSGPSGCGKSTLIRLLQGFLHAEEGSVRIDGRDTRAFAANELRSRLGVVPQDTLLFAGTLLDNLQLANAAASIEHVVQACRLADIHETIEALPEGYRTEVGERGAGLSGGQKQRLALARALLRRPGVLLLDEPFSQLDGDSAARIAAAVTKLKGAVTILIVTHAVPSGLVFDRRIDLGAPTAHESIAA